MKRIRLSERETSALQNALAKVEGEKFLFGSRTNPEARGGDIDVLIRSDEDGFVLSREVSRSFLRELEQTLDVVVIPRSHPTASQQAFLNTLTLERLPW